MRKSLALVVALCLVGGGCTDAESPEGADQAPRDSVPTGYVLPKERPADCELANGRFHEHPPPSSYGAVLSPTELDPNDVIDSIHVSVEPAKEDREVSADEEEINEERAIGGRKVRIAKAMRTVAIDWWENGWRVNVTAAERHEGFAIDTAAGVALPARGGSPQDTDVRVPEGLSMVADVTDRRTSASYTITTSRCSNRKPEHVTMIVYFIERGADPRLLGLPGRNERRSDGGRDYWVHAERGGIAWTEGPALASVVTAVREPELFDHVRSLRRVSRDDVEEWIAEAETQR